VLKIKQYPANNFMKSIALLSIYILAAMLLGGCGVVSSESMYEGVRSQQKANSGGIEPKQPILPTYQQYQQERNTLK
jgi:hypothetical protein